MLFKPMNGSDYIFTHVGEMKFPDPNDDPIGSSQRYASFNEEGIDCYNQIEKKTGEVSYHAFRPIMFAITTNVGWPGGSLPITRDAYSQRLCLTIYPSADRRSSNHTLSVVRENAMDTLQALVRMKHYTEQMLHGTLDNHRRIL